MEALWQQLLRCPTWVPVHRDSFVDTFGSSTYRGDPARFLLHSYETVMLLRTRLSMRLGDHAATHADVREGAAVVIQKVWRGWVVRRDKWDIDTPVGRTWTRCARAHFEGETAVPK